MEFLLNGDLMVIIITSMKSSQELHKVWPPRGPPVSESLCLSLYNEENGWKLVWGDLTRNLLIVKGPKGRVGHF